MLHITGQRKKQNFHLMLLYLITYIFLHYRDRDLNNLFAYKLMIIYDYHITIFINKHMLLVAGWNDYEQQLYNSSIK